MGNQYSQSSGWIEQWALPDDIEMAKELWPGEGTAFVAAHLILFHVNHLPSKYLSISQKQETIPMDSFSSPPLLSSTLCL